MNIGVMSCLEDTDEDGYKIFAFGSDQSLFEFDLLIWMIEGLYYDYRRIEHRNDITIAYDDVKRIINDKNRRLREIKWLMEMGRTLVVLLPSPRNFRADDKYMEIKNSDLVDYYSFLPEEIALQLRPVTSPARGKQMEFRGDPELLGFWELIKDVAWYGAYLLSPVGKPFIYIKGTTYPVATMFEYGKGRIFVIPGTYDDGYDDCDVFVEACKSLVALPVSDDNHLPRADSDRENDKKVDNQKKNTDNFKIEHPENIPEQVEDICTCYEVGISQFLRLLGNDHPMYQDTLVYQQRLLENIKYYRRYGDTEIKRAERSEIIDRLNIISLMYLKKSFVDLCNS